MEIRESLTLGILKSIISNNSYKFVLPDVEPISNTPVPEDVALTALLSVPSAAVVKSAILLAISASIANLLKTDSCTKSVCEAATFCGVVFGFAVASFGGV